MRMSFQYSGRSGEELSEVQVAIEQEENLIV